MKLVIPVLLPIEEEEGLVFSVIKPGDTDRSTDVEAVIMSAYSVPEVAAGIVGIKHIIANVIVCRTVILVAARLDDLIENRAGNRSEFSIEITGLNRDF